MHSQVVEAKNGFLHFLPVNEEISYGVVLYKVAGQNVYYTRGVYVVSPRETCRGCSPYLISKVTLTSPVPTASCNPSGLSTLPIRV